VFQRYVAGEGETQIHEKPAAAFARPDAVEAEDARDPRHGIRDQRAGSRGRGVNQGVDSPFPQAQRDVNNNPRHTSAAAGSASRSQWIFRWSEM